MKRDYFSFRTLLFLTTVLLCSFIAESASVRLSVMTGRGKRDIAVGELFYISYEVTDIESAPEKPTDVPGAKVMYFERTGQSSRFSRSMDGKTTQSYSYTYTLTLRAQQEGSYTFGPVSVGGVQSNKISYNIGVASAESQSPSGSQQQVQPGQNSGESGPKFIGKGDGNLFLKADVSKSTAYEQEALVYTVKLYTTYDAIKFIGATSAPKFDGFVVEESKDISTSLEYETYNGKSYATAVIARYIIFPQMEGQLKVRGNTYTVSVDEREYYHDPFWGSLSVAKPLQLNVTPNDLTVNVKGLPKPVPADFSGGVGHFTLTSNLPTQEYQSNQAASIVYTVSGSGNLKYITLPDLNKLYPPELEIYSPSTDVDAKVGRNDVSGSVKFDYSFVPAESGSFQIPSVTLVYFNPQTGGYERSTAQGYNIVVGRGKGSEKSQTMGKMAFNPKLLPVKENLKFEHRPYVTGFAYWLFYIIPIALLIFSAIWYRSYLNANADIMAVKSRKASRLARKKLKKAAQCMQSGDSEHFYDEMLSALWGYVSDKLKLPTSELNRENVSGQMASRGLDESHIKTFIDLIDDCEFEKYSPSSARKDMKEVYDQGVNVINGLEDAFRKIKGKE